MKAHSIRRDSTARQSIWKVLLLLPFLWFATLGEALHHHEPKPANAPHFGAQKRVADGHFAFAERIKAGPNAGGECFACRWSATPFLMALALALSCFTAAPRFSARSLRAGQDKQPRSFSIRGPPISV